MTPGTQVQRKQFPGILLGTIIYVGESTYEEILCACIQIPGEFLHADVAIELIEPYVAPPTPFNLRDFVRRVGEWQFETFGPDLTPELLELTFAKLREEVGELEAEPCPFEAADAIIPVLGLAARQGWDMERALEEKFALVREKYRRRS